MICLPSTFENVPLPSPVPAYSPCAIETVHRLLLERRKDGAAILLISEDLDEILALADRIDVMYEGRIVGSFDAAMADVHEIGLLMTGGAGGAGAAPDSAAEPAIPS